MTSVKELTRRELAEEKAEKRRLEEAHDAFMAAGIKCGVITSASLFAITFLPPLRRRLNIPSRALLPSALFVPSFYLCGSRAEHELITRQYTQAHPRHTQHPDAHPPKVGGDHHHIDDKSAESAKTAPTPDHSKGKDDTNKGFKQAGGTTAKSGGASQPSAKDDGGSGSTSSGGHTGGSSGATAKSGGASQPSAKDDGGSGSTSSGGSTGGAGKSASAAPGGSAPTSGPASGSPATTKPGSAPPAKDDKGGQAKPNVDPKKGGSDAGANQ